MRSRGLVVAGIVAALGVALTPAVAAADDVAPRVVYVTSTLPAGYPLADAVRNWNRNGRVELVIVDACPGVGQCVDFSLADLTADDANGRLSYITTGEGCAAWAPACTTRWHIDLASAVTAEWAYASRADRRIWQYRRSIRSTICHELGHVLGADHWDGGCMKPGRDGVDSPYAGPTAQAVVRSGLRDDTSLG